jgi:intracellular septation protein
MQPDLGTRTSADPTAAHREGRQQAPAMREASKPAPGVKLAIELGPLLAFLLTIGVAGIMWATAVLMVAVVVALAASWQVYGRIAAVPAVTAVLVLLFGGLTLWLDDSRFIKIKPTIVNLLFAGALLLGLILRRPFLKTLLGEALHLTPEGWRKLSLRWMWFFLTLALLNEIVWRNFSDAVWGTFKALGILSLTILFAMTQIGLIRRHEAVAVDEGAAVSSDGRRDEVSRKRRQFRG